MSDAERDRPGAEHALIRRAWLRVIQEQNSCPPTGQPCAAKRCGCQGEQEILIRDAQEEEATALQAAYAAARREWWAMVRRVIDARLSERQEGKDG
jgi:ethanolamine ammonia-lyase small subunit